jgi:hypothetical protein
VKLVDVVNQLRLLLPKYTDKFSSTLSISSLTASAGILTVVTPTAHGLSTGKAVTLSGIKTQIPITRVSQDGLIFTFTSDEHDLTFGWPEHNTIEMIGFTESVWNGTFPLNNVPNRETFKTQSLETIPTLNGNEKLLEIRNNGPNGQYSITKINSVTFTVEGDFDEGIYLDGIVSSGVRVAGSVTLERAIEEYTKQNITDLWGFVLMHDVEVSKDRYSYSDATSAPTQGTNIRARFIDGFTFLVIANTTQDISAQQAVDICRHDLLLPIIKSIRGSIFPTGLSNSGDFRTVMTGHGMAEYNKAFYAHMYTFEVSSDLTEDDAVEVSDTRAFRDIDYTQSVSDTEDMTVKINLDDDPI